jgi:hypothetical protein
MTSPTSSSDPTIAFLAQGRIRIKEGKLAPRTVDSIYGNSIREKAVRAQQKHSWKAAGENASPFGAALWGKSATSGQIPIAITSICGGKDPGALLYSLESGSLCALLEVENLGGEERRVWNDNRTQIRHVFMSRDSGDMVFSLLHQNGTANIGVKISGQGGIQELTEGDSFDTAPRWRPGPGRKILYQSAGIGRNRHGHFLALGPFCIQQLDVEAGELTTLLEDSEYDYLAPECLEDGTLLYIRRPYVQQGRFNPLRAIKELVLFPFRLIYAVVQYLNFFSAMYTGRKLTTGGAKAREMDMKQMMVWGNIVRAQREAGLDEEGTDLVPKSWQLCSRNPQGETKVLAAGVLAYDLSEEGQIVLTNGNAIFLLHPDGRKERVLNERMIEQVFFLRS